MGIFRKIKMFFESFFKKKSEKEVTVQEDIEEQIEGITEDENDTIISNRTILNKLYSLEQAISIFEHDLQSDYNSFLKRIEDIREWYNVALQESEKPLTFEINPNLDYKKKMEVIKLEEEITRFIELNIKFNVLSRQLQSLIIKLNILYNASIHHENKKDKILLQLERALNSEFDILDDLKKCKYILEDSKSKDRLVSLMTYVDYLIFKTYIRNSDMEYGEIISKLSVINKFDGNEVIFKDYMIDEITDLNDLIDLNTKNVSGSVFLKNKVTSLLTKINEITNIKDCILNASNWEEFITLENSIINFFSTCQNENIKIKILDKIDITVKEDDVIISPRINTIMNLSNLFCDVSDNNILIVIKLLRNVSDEVTYKEIYFLIILFGILDEIKSTNNTIYKFIEKYENKYSYSSKKIDMKKDQVKEMTSKKYISIFEIKEHEEQIIESTLISANLDYKIDNNRVYLNSVYFNGLEIIFKSLNKKVRIKK